MSEHICVGISGGGQCKRLNVKECTGKNCAFYQTEKQESISREKAFKRIASLEHLEQKTIADKYYGGKMPWKL